MSQNNSVIKKSGGVRFLLLICAAVALWVATPFGVQMASTTTQAQDAPDAGLVAELTGAPIASVTPHGLGTYNASPTATPPFSQLYVEVGSVNLAAGTQLSVFLNTNNIGSITLDQFRHGVLFLSTLNGGTVPTVVAGDALSVKNGETTILAGTFAAQATPSPTATHTPFPTPSPTATHTPFPTPSHTPFPTPSPTATHTPFPTPSHTPFPSPSPTGSPVPIVHLFAPLSGDPIGGISPRGIGRYDSYGDFRHIDVYVSFVNLPEGTVLSVSAGTQANPVALGTITLHDHYGALHLDTHNGGTVPVIENGEPITISDGATTVLAGIFSDMPPSPSPTPSHSPTATPTPVVPHAFVAQLRGSNEVPPVTTEGRGIGFVLLNHDETQIGVNVGVFHLSSAATSITINGPAMAGENGPVIFTLAIPTGSTLQMFDVTAEQVAQLRTGLWYFQVSTANNPTGEIRGQIHSFNHREDFDGDGQSDITVTRRIDGAPDNTSFHWYTLNSSNNTVSEQAIGRPGDINVQGDYDGDGIADIAMFTPGTGDWQIRGSATGADTKIHWGSNGDIPVVGDFDGDGISDRAVFRPSDGNWYIQRSSDNGVTAVHWGTTGDRPVSGDFDGDGRNDLAVFRPSEGNWYILRSSDGGMTAIHWGLNGDQPVTGDYDGDGMSDIGVFRPSESTWYIFRSSDSQLIALKFGSAGDIPVPCEFDGDGLTDIAVFRPSDGNWYINQSSDNKMAVFHFGIQTDHPTATVYAP